MAAQLIDGAATAKKIRAEVGEAVAKRIAEGKSKPGLATVLVGDNPASHVYVKSKQKACQELGIESFGYDLPADASQTKVEELVKKLNDDPKVNGILVQLPLPAGLDEERVLSSISIEKDVDGFHSMNIGRLAQKGREPLFIPCTPAGVMYLLHEVMPSLEGKNAVVLGRSNIVGMPVALLLVRANATMTICHSKTKDLKDVVRSADVLVAAVGRPEMVKGDWIKPGAVVIDVGINRVDDASRPKGYRLTGDVNFEEAMDVASFVTPVPGGVGPMTIAMLMKNTLHAAEISDR
jgi:methylenetetrahydrofolate dehydrogenase (NADP+)/methenyltetrahydrofolate cyclohydrolase